MVRANTGRGLNIPFSHESARLYKKGGYTNSTHPRSPTLHICFATVETRALRACCASSPPPASPKPTYHGSCVTSSCPPFPCISCRGSRASDADGDGVEGELSAWPRIPRNPLAGCPRDVPQSGGDAATAAAAQPARVPALEGRFFLGVDDRAPPQGRSAACAALFIGSFLFCWEEKEN